MKKINSRRVLLNAKALGDEWLKAWKLESKPDSNLVFKELCKRTHNGNLVLTLVVNNPQDIRSAILFGIAVIKSLNKNVEPQFSG